MSKKFALRSVSKQMRLAYLTQKYGSFKKLSLIRFKELGGFKIPYQSHISVYDFKCVHYFILKNSRVFLEVTLTCGELN